MGVNANFQADFTTFMNAVDMAIVKLADFGKGAEDVELKLNNMVDKWSGRALIQQANEMVVVMTKVGGVTALTTGEQEKLNTILQEAIAKYHVIGEQVPSDLQKLADQTKAVTDATATAKTTTTDWMGILQGVAGAFGVAFSVGAVVNFGKELFADAQALDTLSKQTRTSVQDLVILRGATESYGVSAEDIGRALFQLRERIAGGDQSVATAYAKMGISMDEVRAKQNDALGLLSMTQTGLAGISSEAQDAASKDLYGGKLGSSMVGLAKGFDDLLAKSQESNKGVGESTKVMAEYADAIGRAERGLKDIATVVVGAPLKALDAFRDAQKEHVSWWKLAVLAIEDWRSASGGTLFTTVAQGLADVNKGQHDIVLTSDKVTAALTQQGEAAQFMATLEKNVGAPLLDWQIKYLEHLKDIGQLTAKNADGVKVTAEQFEKYKADVDAAKKATEDLAKAQAEQNRIAMDAYTAQIKTLEAVAQANLKAYGEDEQIKQLEALRAKEVELANAVYAQLTSEKDRGKLRDDLAVKLNAIDLQETAIEQKKLQRTNANVVAELDAQSRILAAYGQNVDGTVKMDTAQGRLQERLDALHRTKSTGIDLYYREIEIMQQFQKEQDAETAGTDKLTEAKKKKVQATEEEIAAAKRAAEMNTFSFAGGSQLDPKFANMSDEAKRIAGYVDLYGRVTPLGESVGFGHAAGGAGGRASGGPVDAGTPYMVGERGPELFVPSSNGTIVPNGGGGMGVTININGSVLGTPDAIARAVGSAFMSVLKAQGTRLPLSTYGSG